MPLHKNHWFTTSNDHTEIAAAYNYSQKYRKQKCMYIIMTIISIRNVIHDHALISMQFAGQCWAQCGSEVELCRYRLCHDIRQYFWVQNTGDMDTDILYCGTLWPSWPTVPVFPGQSRFGTLCPGIPNVVFGMPKCPGRDRTQSTLFRLAASDNHLLPLAQ